MGGIDLGDILGWVDEKIESNLEQCKEAGNCPGFNQALGAIDVLRDLKDFIEGGRSE